MSYILDALKRADAERERGHVPGLHAQPLGGPAPQPAPAGAAPRWAWLAAGLVGMVVVAALAWRLGADTAAPVPATVALPAPEPTAVAAVTPPAPEPAMNVAPARPPAAPQSDPVTLAPVAPPPPRAVAPSARAVEPSPRAVAPPATTAPAPAASTAETRIPLYAQLPPALRQQVPGLAVTGSVYSDDVASRFIMLNGEVAKEGSQPQPGLVVERIEPRSVVLRYKGERFRLPY